MAIKQKHDTSIEGIAIQRANERFSQEYMDFIDPDGLKHFCKGTENVTLCNLSAFCEGFSDPSGVCPVCQEKLLPIYQAWLAEEIKNYWKNPSGGSGVRAEPVIKKVKPVPEYRQLSLPDEFLPVGSGKLINYA